MPIIASLLTYLAMGQLYTTSLSENDLVSSTGQVSIIKQDIFLDNNCRDTTRRVSIKLLNSNDNFFLFDNNGDIYESIKQKVIAGDEVSIFHRTLLQSIIGFGNKFQIFKIEKGRDILYNVDEAKQTFGAVNVFEISVMTALWFLYFYLRYIQKLQKQQPHRH
ncbi:MAG: hypothetical protein QM802_17495 [Agriterribacter sp.]